jgi:hypothetical protein
MVPVELTLGADEHTKLSEYLTRMNFKRAAVEGYRSPYQDDFAQNLAFADTFRRLAPEFSRAVETVKAQEVPLIVFRGMPLGELGELPENEQAVAIKPDYVSEQILQGISGLLGSRSAFLDSGVVIDHVVQRAAKTQPKTSDEPVADKRGVALRAHTEAAMREQPPHFVALSCLRAPEEEAERPATIFWMQKDIITALRNERPDLLEALKQPEFRTISARASNRRDDFSIIDETEQKIILGSFKGTTQDSQAALGEFLEFLDQVPHHEVSLGKGDLVLFDNEQVVHARAGTLDLGAERWLSRSNTVRHPITEGDLSRAHLRKHENSGFEMSDIMGQLIVKAGGKPASERSHEERFADAARMQQYLIDNPNDPLVQRYLEIAGGYLQALRDEGR